MGVPTGNFRSEGYEWITNRDLVDSAHELMGGIDLDPASSAKANEYVGARSFYTPQDDGLNDQQWFGRVYVFPPPNTYFWDKKNDCWTPTRGMSPSLTSGHAAWWRTLKKKWLAREVEQAIFFSNFIDTVMYNQDMFDFPVCIMKARPTLLRHYFDDNRVERKRTGCSIIVYLQPRDETSEKTQDFIDIYSEKGRILV